MSKFRALTWRSKAAGIAIGAVAGLAALSGTALAAPATGAAKLPKAGTNLLVNGDFAKPGPAKNEGDPPTGWTLVDLGAETDPYSASIGVYNAKGKYPPPTGNPNKADIADNVFYEAGTATGIEGIGGQQTTFAKPITQANNPQVSFSNVEVTGPETTVADWAGSGLQIIVTSGKKTDTLIYLNPWAPPTGTYSGAPVNTATTKYILGPALAASTWNTQAARSLNTDIAAQFKLKSYKVASVTFINLEDTTSSASPYPNMNGYMADLAITEGSAS
jgi:hypothetical protein